MDAIRELVAIKDRTVTITLPHHFHARRVAVIVLDADEAATVVAKRPATGLQPAPLLAGTWIAGAC